MQNKLVQKIIKEAKYENDQAVVSIIKAIIKKIKNTVLNYSGINNDIVDWYPEYQVFYIKFDSLNLNVILFGYNSKHNLAIEANEKGIDGIFYHTLTPRQLHLFDCELIFDKETNKCLKVSFDETTAFHELIHFYDYLRIEQNKKETNKNIKSNQKKGIADDDYYNSPLEFNAYFMEKVTPQIENLIHDPNILKQVKNGGWEKFKQVMTTNPSINQYFVKLNEKFRKKFLKRLAEYYQKITDGIN